MRGSERALDWYRLACLRIGAVQAPAHVSCLNVKEASREEGSVCPFGCTWEPLSVRCVHVVGCLVSILRYTDGVDGCQHRVARRLTASVDVAAAR